MLATHGIENAFHYAPLHYLAHIARASALYSKTHLREVGFGLSHFRSTSQRQDISRGFETYVHLSSCPEPPILNAKLRAGFPHFEIVIPAEAIEDYEYHLCRFNIAKARYFKGAKRCPEESPKNGRYYEGRALPIAVTDKEKGDLLAGHSPDSMIEVLVPGLLHLPESVSFRFFSAEDESIAAGVLAALKLEWKCETSIGGVEYKGNGRYRKAVGDYLEASLDDPSWRGNGLEFDRV